MDITNTPNGQLTISSRFAKDFDARHSKDGPPITDGQTWHFPDGSWREFDVLGASAEPSSDDFTRLTNIVKYYTLRLAKAVRQFDEAKEIALMDPTCNSAGLEKLKALQDAIGWEQDLVNVAKAKLAATPQAQAQESSKRFAAEQALRRQEYKAKIQAIRV